MKSLAAIVAIAALVATAALAQGALPAPTTPPVSPQPPKHVPSPQVLEIFDKAFGAIAYAPVVDVATPDMPEFVVIGKEPCPVKTLADKGWLFAVLAPENLDKDNKGIGGCWSIKENMIAILWMNQQTDVFPMQGWHPMPKYKKEFDEAQKKFDEVKHAEKPKPKRAPEYPIPSNIDPYHGGLVYAKGQ